MSSAIFYGSSTGNTENAAKLIREELGGKDVIKLFDISRITSYNVCYTKLLRNLLHPK